jgi:hypothetical protein
VSGKNAWEGKWEERIYRYARGLGFQNLTDFAEARPQATFEDLARELGPDVAQVQLEVLLRGEALEGGRLKRFAMSSLVRTLREWLPEGWAVGERWDFNRARALAKWSSIVGSEYRGEVEALREALRSTKVEKGWLPESISDALIVDLFKGCDFARRETSEDSQLKKPLAFSEMVPGESTSTIAYWIGTCEPATVRQLSVKELSSAMSYQYDLEDQAERYGTLLSKESDLMRSFTPIAPVQLTRKWSPLPTAWSALGRPDSAMAWKESDGRLDVVALWEKNPQFTPVDPHAARNVDEGRFLYLLQEAVSRSRANYRGILLVTKPGWAYSRFHDFTPEAKRLMREAGFVVTDRVERRH